MAKVIKTVPYKTVLDKVDIKVLVILKGKLEKKEIQLILQVRGGLKEWDPELKKDETGVFFLKKEQNGSYRVAHGGSISIFKNTIYK